MTRVDGRQVTISEVPDMGQVHDGRRYTQAPPDDKRPRTTHVSRRHGLDPMTALGLDIGTSAVKGLLLDADGRVVASTRRSYALDLPAPGRVELPAERVWRAVAAVITVLAVAGRDIGSPVEVIAASGSGDEVAMLDAAGRPVGPVIVALDTRSDAIGRAVERRLGGAELYARTGVALTELSPRGEAPVAARARADARGAGPAGCWHGRSW